MESSLIEKISNLIDQVGVVGGKWWMVEDVDEKEKMWCCECGLSLDLMALQSRREQFCRVCGRGCCRKCVETNPNSQAEEEKEGGFMCSLCRQCMETPYFTPQISPSPSIMSFGSCASSLGDLSSNFLSSDRNYDDYGQYEDQYDDEEEDRDPYNTECGVVANPESREEYLDESVVDLSGRVSPGAPISMGEAPKNEDKEDNVRDHIYGDHECQGQEERVDLESSMFNGSGGKSEQTPFHIDIDIHNNKSIYVPPKPEEEFEDWAGESNGSMMVDDDDDDDDEGLPRAPEMLSLGSKKHKIEDIPGEEHKKSMKAVVDGHFRFLVQQLLAGENLDIETWKEIVCSVAWEAALYIKPAASEGKAMDPGGYVKVKCVACGKRTESKVIKGVVFKKNVSHKHMSKIYKNPRLLLWGGALEYERASNQLSSLNTVLQEEIDYLNMVAEKIDDQHPNVLLVEKTVARHAQEVLLNSKISLVLDVKKTRLERIAQCTGAPIISSVDNLSLSHIKHCDLFHVEKFVEEHGSAGEADKKLTKNLMFFEGCPKPLGCTILLKGASGDELKRVKCVVQYAVFAAYQLALETSFLADERASFLESSLNATASMGMPSKHTSLNSSLSTSPGFAVPVLGKWRGEVQMQIKDDKDMTISPSLSSDSNYVGGVSRPNSPTSAPKPKKCVSMPISLDVRRTSEVMHQKGTNGVCDGLTQPSMPSSHIVSGLSASFKKALGEALPNIGTGSYAAITSYFGIKGIKFKNSSVDDVSEFSVASQDYHRGDSLEEAPSTVRLRNQGITDDQNDSNSLESQPVFENKNQDSTYLEERGLSRESLSSSNLGDHPSILVSFSSRCILKGTVCERSHLSRIKYYGSCDKSLGRFLRDRLFDQNFLCHACGEHPTAHAYCYTHQQGKLAISVQKLHSDLSLPGEREGKIWMWYRCLKCPWKDAVPQGNSRVVMSDAASGLSFGKFLELSFSNHAAASRVASCGHSLHRECLRFYGLGNMVACFHYSAISVFGVRLPPPKIEFSNPNQQEWLTKEVEEVSKKGRDLFSEIFSCIHQTNVNASASYPGIVVLEGMLQKEREEFEESLQKAVTGNCQPGQPGADILELNRLRWQLLFESCVWEYRIRHLHSPNKVERSLVNSFCDQQDLNSSVEKENKSLEKPGSSLMTHNMVIGTTTSKGHGDGCAVKNKCTDNEETKAGSDMEIPDAVVESLSVTSSLQDLNSMDQLTEIQRESDKPADSTVDIDSRQVHLVLLDGKEHVRGLNTPGQDRTSQAAYDECLNNSNSSGNQTHSLVGSGDNVDLLEEDLEIHKPLSEGLSYNLPDFTETFDAAWTGDLSLAVQTANVKSHGQVLVNGHSAIENSGAYTELPLEAVCKPVQQSQDQSTVKTESCDSGFDMQDKDRLDLAHANMPSLADRSFDVLKDIESLIWHPFSDLFMVCIKDPQKFLSICKLIRCCSPMFLNSAFKLLNEGGARLLLPPGIDNTVIAVYDDEPTSLIAYALSSKQHWAQISDDPLEDRQKEKLEDIHREALDSNGTDIAVPQTLQHIDSLSEMAELGSEGRSTSSTGASTSGSYGISAADQSLRTKMRRVEICFGDENQLGKVKYSVICYHAKQFSALRKTCCPTEMEFIRSLSRCKKWGAQGGKSKVFFAKTLDDRFIIKQVTKTELESFLEFAPEYFKHLTFSLSTGSPTCLAKILGIYQVTIKHSKGGKDVKMDLMVMENLLFGKSVTRLYDLKGSLRNRYNPDSSGVLLDQNFIEAMLTSPIFVGNKAKHHLERAVWNDTSFLNTIHVMDYSLLVGVDEKGRELVLGIIDFMRQYTWDKHLETWVKASGILGGPKNEPPTVISPKEYKKRFRKAISTYFQAVPDSWPPQLILSQIESGEDNRKESDRDQIH